MVPNLKSLHILVVEDMPPLRELTISVLKAQGFTNVSFATDGQKGFEAFCRHKPDIVLTDWSMPVMNGLDMVRQIRTSKASPNKMVPVVMMTGFAAPAKISEARDSGMTEFLVKPFSAKDLSRRLMHIIKSPRDFVVTKDFFGPDRRRTCAANYAGIDRRTLQNGPMELIKAKNELQDKAGYATVDDRIVASSQKLMDENKINFLPYAQAFIKQFGESLHRALQEKETTHRSIELLIDPIMQIKANARIFKYDLMGDLASTMLGFLENLKELDRDALDIIEAHHTTLMHIISHEIQGTGGQIGESLLVELEDACKRYMKSRAKTLAGRFLVVLDQNHAAS